MQNFMALRHGAARIALMLLCAPLLVLPARGAAPAPFDPFDDCDSYSMADKHACIAKLANSSALALEKAEAKAAAAISLSGGNASNLRQARARLKASSAAFSAYRVDQCAFAMATIGGGAGDARDTTRLTCLARKNLQRAQELARETDGLSRK